jgi:hypothetical protein
LRKGGRSRPGSHSSPAMEMRARSPGHHASLIPESIRLTHLWTQAYCLRKTTRRKVNSNWRDFKIWVRKHFKVHTAKRKMWRFFSLVFSYSSLHSLGRHLQGGHECLLLVFPELRSTRQKGKADKQPGSPPPCSSLGTYFLS